MNRSRLLSRLAGSVLLVLAAACANDEPTGPRQADMQAIDRDIAATAGAGIASDVAVWISNEAAVSPAFARDGATGAGTCTASAGTRTCTGGHEGTLTVTRTVSFYDATGALQAAFDAATTERIDFTTTASGTRSGTDVTSTLNRATTMSVSGLAGAETQRTWNGHGATTINTTFTGATVTRQHAMVEQDTTTNVVWVVAPTRGAYPASGSVVRRIAATTTLSGDRTGSFSSTRRVLVTFNGTSLVPMQVQAVGPRGNSMTLSCTLDLAARTVSCTNAA